MPSTMQRPLTSRTGPRALALLLLLAAGCSRERRHAVLTFFFDGVPPLDAVGAAAPEVSSQFIREGTLQVTRLDMVRHKPFERNECTGCHPKERSFWLEQDFDRIGLCFKCHEHEPFRDRLEKLSFVHGPVAVKSCLLCHDPHESIHRGLLVLPEPRLCYECHDRGLMLEDPQHLGEGPETCLRCHDPHGGAAPFFLKGPSKPGAGR
ncbi:MAG: hypothetical protein HY721_08830 [Planctomycetes bacterium]|nr:hypothetical protein [Planctomycetota bacterium]